MTDELKAKMAEGRRKAAEARTAAQLEASMAPGFERDEALRAHTDAAEESMENLVNETGAHAIDPAKLDVKNVDNEIAAHWNAERGDIPFSHPQQGYWYAWVTHEDPHSSNARTSIRAMHSHMRRVGWHPVEGNMPEGKEFVGEGPASGTTNRGVGDTFLWRIRMEDWEKVIEHNRRRAMKDQGIEEAFAHAANSTGVTRALDEGMLSRVYGQDRMRPVAFSAAFNDSQIRSGNGPLKPGFELRGRR